SIGDGLKVSIENEFEQIGGYTAIWSWAPNPWYRNNQGRWVRRNWEEHLTNQDIEAIKAETDRVEFIIPNVSIGGDEWDIRYTSSSRGGNIISTAPDYLLAENLNVAKGRFLRAFDLINTMKVCIIGSDIAEDLFGPGVNPIDKEVKLGKTRYTVVGVLEQKEFFDNDYNERIIIPVTTAQRRIFGNDYLNYINVKVMNPEDVDEVVAAMKRVYRRLHKHGDEFGIRTGQEALDQINKIIFIMKAVAGGIAGISLIVGGIGIMNIMLVSVTERTREIGIRKAVGARRSNILWQFLVEAILLCLIGGLLGILLGLAIGSGIAALISSISENMEFQSVISLKMMLFTVGFSMFVGITFGVYPAWRASRLDPVEALCHE
ncbi:MAG TPA: ABC transporter permease, partial [Anaerolineae bacterium]|nr:ABC transporter permease [Anaerolineae bacterium]